MEKEKYESIIGEKDRKIKDLEAKIKDMECKLEVNPNSQKTIGQKDETSPIVFLNYPNTFLQLIEIGEFEPLALKVEEIESAGPGWLVIQNRFNGTVDFFGPEDRFLGTLDGEYWIGCERVHRLTNQKRNELYIELVDFDGKKAFARYNNFRVGSSCEGYRLISLGAYSGNAGDALRSHEGSTFSYCAITINGRFEKFWWWYANGNNQCNLNGPFLTAKTQLKNKLGIWWSNWYCGSVYSLKSCKMLIRPTL